MNAYKLTIGIYQQPSWWLPFFSFFNYNHIVQLFMTMITPVSVHSSNVLIQFHKKTGGKAKKPCFSTMVPPHWNSLPLEARLSFPPHLTSSYPTHLWKVAKTALFHRAFGLMHHHELDLISLLYTVLNIVLLFVSYCSSDL